MPQEDIEIYGARENNLKNVSLRIPKRKLTIFTGVSGRPEHSWGNILYPHDMGLQMLSYS